MESVADMFEGCTKSKYQVQFEVREPKKEHGEEHTFIPEHFFLSHTSEDRTIGGAVESKEIVKWKNHIFLYRTGVGIEGLKEEEQKEGELAFLFAKKRARLVDRQREKCVSRKIKFTVSLLDTLAKIETDPRLFVTTSFSTNNVYNDQPIQFTWNKGKRPSIQFVLDLPEGLELPADASIWFNAMTRQKSSEGYVLYENAGVGRLMVADLLKCTEEKDIVKHQAAKWNKKTKTVEHVVALAMPHPLARAEPKVIATVTLKNKKAKLLASSDDIAFRLPSAYDWTPGNKSRVEMMGYLAVENEMCMFYGGRNGLGKKVPPALPTISPELEHVHAPYYATGLTNLPGFVYFANLTDQQPPKEEIFQTLIENVLARHKMSKEEFVCLAGDFLDTVDAKSGKQRKKLSETRRYELLQASAIVMEMASQVANSLPYIGDFEVDTIEDEEEKGVGKAEKGNKTLRKKAAILQRLTQKRGDKLDKNFWKKNPRMSLRVGSFFKKFATVHTERHGDESFDDAMRRGAGDCEDLAHLILRVFRHLQENEWSSPELKAAHAISKHYAISAALVSVTARNLAEGQHYTLGEVKINSKEDKSAKFGAHMTTIATPLYQLGQIADRSNGAAFTKKELSLPNGMSADDPHVKRSKALSVLIGEGTGPLYALPLAPEAYVASEEEKVRLEDIALKSTDADARLQTGKSLYEIHNSGGSAQKMEALAACDVIKQQKEFVNHKNVRFSPFFRDISALFFVLPKRQEPIKTGLYSHETRLPEVFKNREDLEVDADVLSSMMSWRVVRPVQIGTREEDIGTEDDVRGEDGKEIMRHGAPMTDYLNKRKHVGMLLAPPETLNMNKAMGSASRHLMPLTPFEETSEKQKAIFARFTENLQRKLDKYVNDPKNAKRRKFAESYLNEFWGRSSKTSYREKDAIASILRARELSAEQRKLLEESPLVVEQLYKKIIDPDVAKVCTSLYKAIAKNKYVLGAVAHRELLCNDLGYIRLDVAVDTTQTIAFNKSLPFEQGEPV